ncbi:MAG: type II toxin-antitoxin system RelE/ParE family toxin [Thiovulaceae bacterium]|nr:type II toxin-antitoxin system RelE/ParE family toxin [Sulfurimonadaceae bacterium]
MTEIVFSKKAAQNLTDQALYIFEQTQSAALSDRYLDDMRDYIAEILSKFPRSGRASDDIAPHTRKLVYQGFSIIYRESDERIEILALYRDNLPK